MTKSRYFKMRLGIIARMDKTGLANQTRNLVYMLNPTKVLVIDSRPFTRHKHNQQYPGIYKNYNGYRNNGFINPRDSRAFLRGIDTLLSCEMFYGDTVITDARRAGVKTFLQYNYEFLGNLQDPNMPVPDVFLAPSYWKLNEMKEKYPNTVHLPPPIDEEAFEEVRQHNMTLDNKPRKLLHIVGNFAIHDRNGTGDLLKALEQTKEDFELTIKTQGDLPFPINDPRVKIDSSNPDNEIDLYRGYDALILPRRYAGLCLPMNEALMAGMPVIMTDIEPNNNVLPKKWLVSAQRKYSFFAKTEIDVFEANAKEIAEKIDWLATADLSQEKQEAKDLAMQNFSFKILREKYEKVLSESNL